MSDPLFLGFGQISRPDIGLLSDSFQNFGEIFEIDKRTALRNIQLEPGILDSLYGLSTKVSREDLRSASGLDRLLLPSLDQLTEVFLDRIPTRLYINKTYFYPETTLGGVGSSQIKYPNVVIYNGSIQCQSVEYKENILNNSLETPVAQKTYLSTSRASLFNTEGDTQNVGYYKSAKFSGSIRVRRRSHVNRIVLPKTSFITKPDVTEFPTHTIRVGVDNGNTGTTTFTKLLVTKNTPLKLYGTLAKGKIELTFTDPGVYFYGVQVQPAETRPNSNPVDFLAVPAQAQSTATQTHTINIDITATGYQNLYNVYIYLYVNPLKVKSITISDINLKEFPDRKDLGLIGFDNLEDLTIKNGSLTILPLWLKTLKTKLRSLDLSLSGDVWRSSSMAYFDYRNSAITPETLPAGMLYTGISYLTIPVKGPLLNANRDNWADSKFEKYIKEQEPRDPNPPANDYRVFTNMRSLSLGDRFLGYKARFDDVFPNLTSLNWSRSQASNDRNYTFIFGALPKINRVDFSTSYDIRASGASGSVTDVGISTSPTAAGHISKYKMGSFLIGGKDQIWHLITGYINNPAEDADGDTPQVPKGWSNWRNNTISIDINRCRNPDNTSQNTKINLQYGSKWLQLSGLSAEFSGGAVFSSASGGASPELLTPKLTALELYGSSTTGNIPSLGGNPGEHTGELLRINIGACNGISVISDNGIDFLLPTNFAPPRAEGSEHRLRDFYLNSLNKSAVFRRDDLVELYNLTDFRAESSALTGRFPVFPLKKLFESDTKRIYINISKSQFYDLSTLSILSGSYFSRDIDKLIAWGINSSGGGVVPPNFEGSSTCEVRLIDTSNSLSSTYPADWSVVSQRGTCILPGSFTSVPGLSFSEITPALSNNVLDKVYKLTGGSGFKQRVLVNDLVRLSSSGTDTILARVLSVNDTSIILDRPINITNPSTLFFFRDTVSISDWFKAGFAKIESFRCKSSRLSGKLHIRTGFSVVKDSSYACFDLSDNLISSYETQSLDKIFSGQNRKITVDLSYNILPPSEIVKILTDVIAIEKRNVFRNTNCLIKLAFNKLLDSGARSNYTQTEIFPVSVTSGPTNVVGLFRNETFQVFSESQIADENGNITTSYVLVNSSSTLRVPGALVGSIYYKKRTDQTQITTENSLGSSFKNLTGIKVDLGFVYQSPSTTPTIISTDYQDETTRNQSITDSGLTPITCPSGISGTCWRNSANQVLRLN